MVGKIGGWLMGHCHRGGLRLQHGLRQNLSWSNGIGIPVRSISFCKVMLYAYLTQQGSWECLMMRRGLSMTDTPTYSCSRLKSLVYELSF